MHAKFLCTIGERNSKRSANGAAVHTGTIFLFREIHRHQQHRVPNSEPATSAFAYIAPIHEADCRTDERGSSLSKVPPSARFYRNTHHR